MDTSRAEHDYEAFRGFAPDDIIEDRLPDHTVTGWHMGDVNAVEYDTYRDDEKQYYRHVFKKNARPSLVAAEDGKQLYLTGGNYRVTDRGIEDNKAMPALLIANPHKRGTKGKKVSSMALFKRKRRRHNPVTVVAAPRKRRRAAARTRAPSVVVVRAPNPVKKLRRTRRRHNPIAHVKTRRHVSRRRRNPIGLGGRGSLDIKSLLLPALMQGGGAVLTSVAAGYLPIPDNLKTGSYAGATKAVIGLGIGWVLAKFVNKKLGQNFAEGALTIAVYDAIKGVTANAGIPMGAMYADMGAMYQPGLGWTTAANTVNDYGYNFAQ